MDPRVEETRKIWTQLIQTTVIKGFTNEEWKQLVEEFKNTVLTKELPTLNFVGFSLLGPKSAKFVKNDIPRLLNDAFSNYPLLTNPEGWVLEDTIGGAKNLIISSDLFKERILSFRPPSPTIRIIEEEDDESEEEDDDIITIEEEEESPKKKLKEEEDDDSKPLRTLEDAIRTFVETRTTRSNDKLLSRYEVYMRFLFWIQWKRNPPYYKNVNEFYRIFEELYPDLVTQKTKKKKYYENFCIHIRHAPRYPVVSR